jgi:predicted transcriptional regulator
VTIESIRSKIIRRLQRFIELDVNGLRSHILSKFLSVKETTVDELHAAITVKYEISRSAIASMVGYIYSKIGVLRSHKESYKTPIIYSLKEEYVDLIRNALESGNIAQPAA